MPTVTLENQEIAYTLRLDKRRKNIQLKVLPTSVIEIVAPVKLNSMEIKHILTTKSKWLRDRLNKLTSLAANPVNQTLVSGCQLLYNGQPHTLTIVPGISRPEVILTPGEVMVKVPGDCVSNHASVAIEQILKVWFVNQAGRLFQERTRHWAPIIGVNPARITIKDQKTRWGSCSSLGNINYNWRVVMAPPQVLDYLVIHELCHMLVPNHSPRFWEQVQRFSPDYQNHRKWLSDNGKILSRIF